MPKSTGEGLCDLRDSSYPPPGCGRTIALLAEPHVVAAAENLLARRKGITPRRARRRPSTASLIKDAEKVGKVVKAVTRLADGGVRLEFGAPEPADAANPWDVAADELEKKRTRQ